VIRIVIADDHHLVRSGLEALLSDAPDMTLVAVAEDGDQAVLLANEHSPDVMLMDLNMGSTSGIDAAREILESQPEIAIVALTAHREGHDVLASFDAGMIGYVVKDAPPADILRAVREAAVGASFLDSKAARTLVDARDGAPTLTDRERDVLRLVALGLTNRQMAVRLGIAEKTVKAHLTGAYARIGVSDRTAAAIWARDNLSHRGKT